MQRLHVWFGMLISHDHCQGEKPYIFNPMLMVISDPFDFFMTLGLSHLITYWCFKVMNEKVNLKVFKQKETSGAKVSIKSIT